MSKELERLAEHLHERLKELIHVLSINQIERDVLTANALFTLGIIELRGAGISEKALREVLEQTRRNQLRLVPKGPDKAAFVIWCSVSGCGSEAAVACSACRSHHCGDHAVTHALECGEKGTA